MKLFGEFFWARRHRMGQRSTRWVPQGGGTTNLGAPWWIVPTLVASPTPSFLYKYPNIPETLGELRKNNSIRHKFQKPQIQSRHHHGEVHTCVSSPPYT